MDVGGWLRGLGLGQYEEQFQDNKIDADLLPRLTVDDLKDIGVSVVGDRRRLLDAIAVIAGAGRPADVPASPTKSVPSKGLQASAERRPITVMFCDLVGSTSLAERLDAEDWRNLVNAYLDEASKAVTDFGGHVLKKLGDGLMALFGYPYAQENDAERAVRAALAIQRALSDLNARNPSNGAPELSARIGIECGSVVVDATGEVFGEAPNVAARVQAAAEPGSVLVTGSVQRQVAGLFVVEEKGAHELKGVAQPLSLYRVVRASGGGRRAGARTLTPFVGREEDIGTLLRRWNRVRAGDGQFVQIIGEPGLGKSRLVEEFHSRLGETPHTWVEWNSSQLLQNTPLHPVAEWGRARFGGQDVAAERRLADLETTLAQVKLDVQETATLLAPLLDIPLPAERAPKFDPEELRRRQLAAMVALLLAGARTQPVVLAFEDLHWADPTSLDLIQALAERGEQAPLLVVATTRPEFRAPWGMRSHHAVVALAPLDRTEVRRMVGEIAAQHTLPQEVVEKVSERTGGVPLFVEEVTRLLVERGEQGGVQAIPPTLQQSLAARLDRLGAAREVAQVGAVLGRDFVYALLRDVAEIDEPALQASLERLADADLLFVEGAPPEAKYRFKHALIQDAAYESLLKSRRQALHRRAAEALRDANAEPEPIAHHFTEAGLDDFAIEWWGKAGDQALRRSAFQEAIAHLGKAIAMADRTGGGRAPGIPGQQPHLLAAYGNALVAARGFGAPETTEAFSKARELSVGEKGAPERLAADYGLWASSYVRGELSSMRTHAKAFLSDVEATPDSPEAGVAYRAAGATHLFAGEYFEARNSLERALALFQPGRDDDLAFHFGQDAGVGAMLHLAMALWPMGDHGRAVSLLEEAKTRIACLTHVGTHANWNLHAALFELMRGDKARAAPNAFELARLTHEHDLPMWGAFGVFLDGLASAGSGVPGRGLEDMRRGAQLLRDQNVLFFDGLVRIALADADARAGDLGRALANLDEALATSERIGHRAFDPELHRTRGEMLLKRDPANPAPAEDAFLTAITIAKQQGTRSFELRASLSLAKLYHSTAHPADAHAVLAPALEGFSPTPEMPKIAEAQALLAALSETDEVKAALASQERRVHLQTAYAHAVLWSKGYGADETKAAFERTGDLATGLGLSAERFPAYYGQWAWSMLRGDARAARGIAGGFLRAAEADRGVAEIGVAHRMLGLTYAYLGDLAGAQSQLELALNTHDHERDSEVREKFGFDPGVATRANLAYASCLSGDLQRARRLSEEAICLARELAHLPSTMNALVYKGLIEIERNDLENLVADAETLLRLSQQHGIEMYAAFSRIHLSWARARLGDARQGTAELRDSLAAFTSQGNQLGVPGYLALLVELEAAAGNDEGALTLIANGLAMAQEGGQHYADSLLHRLRGDIILKRYAANPAPAEEAYRTAIVIGKQQAARGYELRAALSLAKLYQSTGRPVEAHAVLAPALEGFTPTPEMPEIEEARVLLAALAEMEEVNAPIVRRERRFRLQTAYSQAMMWSKGYNAEETKAAFARASELAGRTNDFSERFFALQGQWGAAITGGELRSARELAFTLLREAEDAGRAVEAGWANAGLGLIAYWHGDFVEARTRCERAIDVRDPNADPKVRERFGDGRTYASSWLAMPAWAMGEVDRARDLINWAIRRASEIGHIGAIADALLFRLLLEVRRGDPLATLRASEALEPFAREHGMIQYVGVAEVHAGWARGRLHDPAGGAAELRQALTALTDHGQRISVPFFYGLLAELEAETLGADTALSHINEALTLAHEIENRCDLALIHRLRGEILLRRGPADPAPAEEAFRTAIAIAKEQGARSPGLQAALALAKLYQLADRCADAHAVLSPALEDFSPTLEMPEIAEARALLAAIEAGTHLTHE